MNRAVLHTCRREETARGARLLTLVAFAALLPLAAGGAQRAGPRTLPTAAADPQLLFSTYLGGSDFDMAGQAAVDAHGNTWVVGTTFSRVDFPVTGGQPSGGSTDAFVAKLSPTGILLVARYLGGSGA